MDYLFQLGLFAGKSFVIVLAVVVILMVIFSLAYRAKFQHQLEVENLNHKNRDLAEILKQSIWNKNELKKEKREEKKKSKKAVNESRPRVYVLDFDGDIKATEVGALREEITTVLNVAKPGDEVVVRLESGGGMVHSYGLAAAQLQRVKDHKLSLTVCVDRIAASGGYMMACTAHKIIASPFAILGSVGVIAQVPNFHRLLKKHDIDYQEITAGEFKRTVSLLGEITPAGREKFQEQVVDTHQLFKQFVASQRPTVDIEQVATGEHWLGLRALDLKLVDQISTSDDYIFEKSKTCDVFRLSYESKKKLSEKIATAFSHGVNMALERFFQRLENEGPKV